MTEDEQPELLKTIEAARLLGVSRSTVLSCTYRGILDYVTTPSGQRRFHLTQIKALGTAGEARRTLTGQPSSPEPGPDS